MLLIAGTVASGGLMARAEASSERHTAAVETRIAALARAVDEAATDERPVREATRLRAAELLITPEEWIELSCLSVLAWRGEHGLAEIREMESGHFSVLAEGLRLSGSQWPDVRARLLARARSEATTAGSIRAAGRLAPATEGDVFGELCGLATDTRSRALRAAVAYAVGAWCDRHVLHPRAVRSALESTPAPFAAAVLQGALAGGDEAALARATGCIGVLTALDAFAAARIGDLAQKLSPPFKNLDEGPLEELLHADDPSVVIEAVRALRSIDAVRSTSALVALLERAHEPGIRRSAVQALERVTGERFGADHRAWRTWHAESERWRSSELPRIRQELDATDRERVHRALLQIARQRAHRHHTGPIVIAATRTTDVATLETAIAVLGQLATTQTVLRLIQLLGHDDTRVQTAAYRSLRFATRRDLGPDPEAWREEFVTSR
ncbi:MAG: HEAT repeat domain-containing protein [Planctomycetota bacterium]